jgi:L-threonylcarbamoyladenylate synthase
MPRIVPDDESGRLEAIAALERGEIVALPTDTVYGIAVSPKLPDGLQRLFAAKARPPDRSIARLVADREQAMSLAVFGAAAAALADAFWPGGLTLVLPCGDRARELVGGAPTIGLRVPAHAAPRALARAVGALPTTSANRSGQPEAGNAQEIVDQLGDAVGLVLDAGPATGGPPSSVVDVTGASVRILRSGAVREEEIDRALRDAGLPGHVGR